MRSSDRPRPVLARVLRRQVVALLAVAAGLALVATPAAEAGSWDHTHPLADHYSYDRHAVLESGYSAIIWRSPYSYEFDYDLADVYPDGKGPILIVKSYENPGNKLLATHSVHNLTGNTTDSVGHFSDNNAYDALSPSIPYLMVSVCNGGSVSSPLGCVTFREDNYWTWSNYPGQ